MAAVNVEDRKKPHPPTRDLRLVPVAAAAWAAAWIGTSGLATAMGIAAALGLAALLAAGVTRRVLVIATALTLLAILGLAGVRQHQHTVSPLAGWAEERALVDIEFTVRVDPKISHKARFGVQQVRAAVEVRWVSARGQSFELRQPVLVTASGANGDALRRLTVGTSARAHARLAAADSGPEVARAALRSPPEVTAAPGAADRAVEAVRSGLRAAVSGLPMDQRALVPALVLGDTSLQTPELVADFRTTGLTHLTAVSGANLTLLLAFLLTMARWAGVRGRGLYVVGLGAVVVFVALCRTEPSVLRASAMGLVALAALGAHAEPGKGARHLCVAVIGLVLIDPWLGRSVGFALSVLASGGIIGWAAVWRDRMGWLPRPVAEAVTVPLAAQAATQPVVTGISGEVSVVGLVTNAVAGPFVGPATVLGFATAGLGVVAPPVAGFTGWLAGWCAQAIVWVAKAGAAFPGAAWRWPADALGLGVVTVACLATLLGMGWVLSRRWVSVVTALVMVAVVARPPVTPGWPPREWVIAQCAVGQGDAIVLRAGPGQAVVVDTGPEPGLLETCLGQLGVVSVPLLVLTHYHADHIGGRSAVWGRGVRLVLVSPFASPAAVATQVRAEAAGVGAAVAEGRPGQRLAVGGVRWHTLGPVRVPRSGGAAPGEVGESSEENDASVVAMAEVGGFRVLLTGDVEPTGQQALLRSGADLRADVLKVPHHGSGRQDEGFFRATGTGVALIGVGEDNDYGHPAVKTLRLLERTGRQTLRTDTQGALALAGTPDAPIAVVERNPTPE